MPVLFTAAPHSPDAEQVLGQCLMKLARRLCSADPLRPGSLTRFPFRKKVQLPASVDFP